MQGQLLFEQILAEHNILIVQQVRRGGQRSRERVVQVWRVFIQRGVEQRHLVDIEVDVFVGKVDEGFGFPPEGRFVVGLLMSGPGENERGKGLVN